MITSSKPAWANRVFMANLGKTLSQGENAPLVHCTLQGFIQSVKNVVFFSFLLLVFNTVVVY